MDFLIDTLNGFLTDRNEDDFFDRLNYQYTPTLFILLAMINITKLYVGSAITCFSKAEFPKSWNEYSKDYCLIENTYYLRTDESIPLELETRNAKQISYYQWVPFMLILQAASFYLVRTHDLGVVAGVADRVLVMYAGKPVEIGTVDEIYYSPRMPYTLGLLGSLPRLDSDRKERLTPIKGAPPSLVNLPAGCPFTPRCPMSQPVCEQKEPELLPTDVPDHRAACHFSDQLVGVQPTELFDASASDMAAPVAEVPTEGAVEHGK
jgi:oligopeptide/dipeptide ABC transporter ATP-binding protein